jgi:hypothetical protein
MACPPGRIQIRRDTLQAWNAVNPVLAAGEFGFAYPDLTISPGAPNGTIKIGPNGGAAWLSSPTIFPTSGGGGGTAGPTGPSGTSTFQFVGIAGLPTITNDQQQGYTITLNTSSNDQVICVNPKMFNIAINGLAFTCRLPNTSAYTTTSVHVGFGEAYGVINANKISYYVGGILVKSATAYTTGDTLIITYDGNGNATFMMMTGTTINSTNTYTYTNVEDYGFIGYQAISDAQTTTITYANMYPIGTKGYQGSTGPAGATGASWTPTILTTLVTGDIYSISVTEITCISLLNEGQFYTAGQLITFTNTNSIPTSIIVGGQYYILSCTAADVDHRVTVVVSKSLGGDPINASI